MVELYIEKLYSLSIFYIFLKMMLMHMPQRGIHFNIVPMYSPLGLGGQNVTLEQKIGENGQNTEGGYVVTLQY